MQSTNHKKKHSYRVSYAIEVGSSFDPDLEDASTWESELQGKFGQEVSGVYLFAFQTKNRVARNQPPMTWRKKNFLNMLSDIRRSRTLQN